MLVNTYIPADVMQNWIRVVIGNVDVLISVVPNLFSLASPYRKKI